MEPVTKALPPTIKLATDGKKRSTRKGKRSDALIMPMADVNYDILPLQIGFWVRRAQLAVMKSFDAHTRELNLRPVEVAAILIVGENPDMSQIVLTTALGTDQSTMVAICTRLEKRELIERRRLQEDRRYQVLNLTSAGVEMAKSVRKALVAHDESLTREMTSTQRKQLISLLQMLVHD